MNAVAFCSFSLLLMILLCEDVMSYPDDPCFVPNPGCSQVLDNLIVDGSPFHVNIFCKEAKKFGKIQNNRVVPMRHLERVFPNAMQGIYERKEDAQ